MKGKGWKDVSCLCSECGKEIQGDHVVIKTRRGTELHIHYGCMTRKRGRTDD